MPGWNTRVLAPPITPPLLWLPAALCHLGSTILGPVLWDSGLPVPTSISNGSEERTQWSYKMSLSQKLCSFASSLGERTSEQLQGERERTGQGKVKIKRTWIAHMLFRNPFWKHNLLKYLKDQLVNTKLFFLKLNSSKFAPRIHVQVYKMLIV